MRRLRIPRHWFHVLIVIVFLGVLAPLALSVIRSGLYYMYDFDELSQLQNIYLLASGYRPFTSFYTIYSPLFHWVFIPIFRWFGFSFETIGFMRFLMVVLFAIRVMLTFALIQKVFRRAVALLFVPLFLLDPFTVFSAMQIRTDTLMLPVYILGLTVFAGGVKRSSKSLLFWSGVLLSGAFLINTKIYPSIVILFGFYGVYALTRRQLNHFTALVFGAFTSLILFAGYFAVTGSLSAMVQQLFLEPLSYLSTVDYPTRFSLFYMPDNSYLYGVSGKPLTWVYVWVLLLGGVAGGYHVVHGLLKAARLEKLDILKLILASSLAGQWIMLFTLDIGFLQYFLPISWLLALFAAVAIQEMLAAVRNENILRVIIVILLGIYILLGNTSIRANTARSHMGSGEIIAKYTRLWKQVPEGSFVFPNMLFRPIAYQLITGYFIGVRAPWLVARFPPMETVLEARQVRYLWLSDFDLSYLSPAMHLYIRSNFAKVQGESDLFIRNGMSEDLH
jgi:hypothetical protein